MRQKGFGVKINGVAAGGLDDRDTGCGDVVAEVGRGGDAIVEIVFVKRFLKANGDGLEIAASEAAVRWVTFGEDEQVLFLAGENVIIGAKKTACLAEIVGGFRFRKPSKRVI